VVIAGGGTAGWVAAAALVQQLGELLEITLVESDEIGTIGVGESTVPPMRTFHKLLRIDEQEFMRACAATFKLGIQFENWGKPGDRYMHPFGRHGQSTWLTEFHHFWLRSLELGAPSELGAYCYEWQAAQAGRFATSREAQINFAYQIDATLYARFLRKFAETRGVRRVEGKIGTIRKHAESGFIEALVLASGEVIEGDLFVDCTGFRGLLIGNALHVGYEDWSHWLFCDSAVALQTESVGPALPYTRSIAHESGWQWRIPLQHRVGNGMVYCSRYISDENARKTLMGNIEGKVLTDPRVIKFRPGQRLKTWSKNCIAIGLASGFIEPLESTSIHLIQRGITRLMQMFPSAGIRQSDIDEYNKQTWQEIEYIRDFIVLHYHVTNRQDSPFWRACRSMEIPASLKHRIALFRETGRVFRAPNELFAENSWIQVMLGQGMYPDSHHPAADLMGDAELADFLGGIRGYVDRTVAQLPSHQAYVEQYCKAAPAASAS